MSGLRRQNSERPQSWTVAVDSQNRIVLKKKELAQQVPWLATLAWKAPDSSETGGKPRSPTKSRSAVCLGVLAQPIPRIQLVKPTAKEEEFWARFVTSFRDADFTDAEEQREDALSIARYGATRLRVHIADRGASYRMTLPDEFRNMEVVPSYAGKVTVFAFQGVCEIWRADRWAKHAGGWEAVFLERRIEVLESIEKLH